MAATKKKGGKRGKEGSALEERTESRKEAMREGDIPKRGGKKSAKGGKKR